MLAMIFERYASPDLPWSLHDQLDVISAKVLVQGAGSGDVKGSRQSIKYWQQLDLEDLE